MEWLRTLFVLMLLTRAIYTDVKKGLIENRCIICGLIMAGVYSAMYKGVAGLVESMKMSIIMLIALFVLFILRGLGAGDIKLFCVLAAFYPRDAIGIVVISFIVAAGIAIARMLVRAIRRKKIYLQGETMSFSIPIGIATVAIEGMQWMKT